MQTDQAILGNAHILKPRKALNKAFLKIKPNRKTDAEMDRLVYEFYGLTEEEITIVENS